MADPLEVEVTQTEAGLHIHISSNPVEAELEVVEETPYR